MGLLAFLLFLSSDSVDMACDESALLSADGITFMLLSPFSVSSNFLLRQVTWLFLSTITALYDAPAGSFPTGQPGFLHFWSCGSLGNSGSFLNFCCVHRFCVPVLLAMTQLLALLLSDLVLLDL